MSQKPDLYAVLGVERNATEAQIKKAFMLVTMTCHPDSAPYKKLDDAKKAEADEKFKYAKEAQAVLTDPVKRTAYDKFGHAGLDGMNNAKSGDGPNWSEAMGPVKKRTRSNEEVFEFFDRAAERNGDSKPAVKTSENTSGMSEEDMRAAAREARRRGRGQSGGDIPLYTRPRDPEPEPEAQQKPAPVAETPPPAQKPAAQSAEKPATVFESVAGKMNEAASRLRDAAKADAPLPVEALENFRDNLQDLIGEVDQAIAKARRGGPKGGYNR